MPDDKLKQKLDRTKISLLEDYEVSYWRRRLGCTLGQLRAAVKAVGPSVRKVRAWLKENG